MVDTKLAEMIKVLERKTAEGELQWKETATSDVFSLALAKYSVTVDRLRQSYNPFDDPEVSFVLYDKTGKHLVKVSAGDFSDRAEMARTLEQLYMNARSQALGLGKAIDDILGGLED